MPNFAHKDLAWCEIDDTLIFLDIANDRYFRLPDACNREFLGELDRSGRARSMQPRLLPRPPAWAPPERQCRHIAEGPFRLADVARALWMQHRVERRLASRPFSSVLFDLRRVTESCERHLPSTICARAQMVRAFEHARLLRSAADRCLPRSIALALCLAARGRRTNVVLGVKLAPFGAHCWAQAGGEVLNDSLEEVLRYTPILVI